MEQLQSRLQLLQETQEELAEAQRLLDNNIASLCCHLEPRGLHLLQTFQTQGLQELILDPALYCL
eukprot:3606271-Ditylum_brightwellii.AAC.1